MLAKTSQADVWMAVDTIATAVIALAALVLSAINFFAKRQDKEETRQWQAATEQRERERDERDRQRDERARARREVADRVWITLEYVGMAETRSPTLVCFEVHVHNYAFRRRPRGVPPQRCFTVVQRTGRTRAYALPVSTATCSADRTRSVPSAVRSWPAGMIATPWARAG